MPLLRIYMFTKQQRFTLGILFSAFNVAQVLLGVLTCVWSIYVITAISPTLHTEKPEIDFVFTVTGMYGMYVIIHYLIGMKICEKCIYKAHKKSTKRHLLFWCLVGCNTIVNIIILTIVSVKISKHIGKSMRQSLEKGIQNYLHNPTWKHTIDNWQYKLQCCGINDYKDWYDLSWLDKYHINIKAPAVTKLKLSPDRFHFPIIPWSCCRTNFPMQCLHDPLQQIQSAHLWKEQPKLVVESINTQGCLEKLRAPIRYSLIGFTVVSVALVLVQIAIIIVSRLLYTSSKNAIILRDPEGESPGYLLTRGCAGQGKRTVSELVLDIRTKQLIAKESKGSENTEKKVTVKKAVKRFTNRPNVDAISPKRLKKKFQEGKLKRQSKIKGHDSNEDPISTEEEEALMLR